MPQTNWYNGFSFRTHLNRPLRGHGYQSKRTWEAYWQQGNIVKTIARSDISLKDLRQKARQFFDNNFLESKEEAGMKGGGENIL